MAYHSKWQFYFNWIDLYFSKVISDAINPSVTAMAILSLLSMVGSIEIEKLFHWVISLRLRRLMAHKKLIKRRANEKHIISEASPKKKILST